MARIPLPEGDGLAVARMYRSVPDMAMAIHQMSKAVYETSSLPIREREVARMRIAQLNRCHV